MPDPTPFLQAREPAAPVESQPVLRERPSVIPPIASSATPPAPSSPAHMPVPPSPRNSPVREGPHPRANAHIGVAHRIHRSPSAGGGAARQQAKWKPSQLTRSTGSRWFANAQHLLRTFCSSRR
ncbi:hypothetical protein QQF64_031890 [Cirrhinus molitorella]|uniref:Uncharacterized protein n=1 Tax=Cirrhinus molitorella TaxID=172907 RepID=A0ABR3MYD3_9TELE